MVEIVYYDVIDYNFRESSNPDVDDEKFILFKDIDGLKKAIDDIKNGRDIFIKDPDGVTTYLQNSILINLMQNSDFLLKAE